jgi:hypothetical protein
MKLSWVDRLCYFLVFAALVIAALVIESRP